MILMISPSTLQGTSLKVFSFLAVHIIQMAPVAVASYCLDFLREIQRLLQVDQRARRSEGIHRRPKLAWKCLHIFCAKGHEMKRCPASSRTLPQKQHWNDGQMFLFSRISAVRSLFLNASHTINLTFSGTFIFQMDAQMDTQHFCWTSRLKLIIHVLQIVTQLL